ncbi:hypothetical protein F5888DRAFT_1629913 [Russula emetica]|nr:hypothetical protein F5888DRAFT_1629913 [Russula emetica]
MTYTVATRKRKMSAGGRFHFHATSDRIQRNLAHVEEAVIWWRLFSVYIVSHIKERWSTADHGSQCRSRGGVVERATCGISSRWWRGQLKDMRATILLRSLGVNKGTSSVVKERIPEDVDGRGPATRSRRRVELSRCGRRSNRFDWGRWIVRGARPVRTGWFDGGAGEVIELSPDRIYRGPISRDSLPTSGQVGISSSQNDSDDNCRLFELDDPLVGTVECGRDGGEATEDRNVLTKLSESVESIIPKGKSVTKTNGDIGDLVEQEMLGAARAIGGNAAAAAAHGAPTKRSSRAGQERNSENVITGGWRVDTPGRIRDEPVHRDGRRCALRHGTHSYEQLIVALNVANFNGSITSPWAPSKGVTISSILDLETRAASVHGRKMRRHKIASQILLILSIVNFVLAVPQAVAVQEINEVRVNAVDVAKVGMAASEKRIDRGSIVNERAGVQYST